MEENNYDQPNIGNNADQENKQQPGQQPDQQPYQQPGQQPNQQPYQQPDQQPDQQPYQQPGQQPDQQPYQQPGQQPNQQPYQQPGQQQYNQQYNQPAQQKKSKMPMILGITIAVILIVAAIGAYFVFFSPGRDLVGEWEASETVEEMGMTAYFNMTLEFRNDNTGTMAFEIYVPGFGEETETEEFEWEKVGDNELELTSNGETETMEYEIRGRGNTLVLQNDDFEELTGSNELEFDRV